MNKDKLVKLLKTDTVKFNEYRKQHPDEKIDLSGVDLDEEDLRTVNLSNADLRNALLRVCNFMSANLSGADLRGADISFSKFSFANLENADFTGATIGKIRLNKTIVKGTKGLMANNGNRDQFTTAGGFC